MAGKQITRHQLAALDAIGEEHVFQTYLEQRSVKKLLTALGPVWTDWCRDEELETEHDQQFGLWPFYRWLDSEEGRRQRWNQLRETAAETMADEVLEINETVTDGTVRVDKLKADNLRWWSQAHNPRYRPGGKQEAVADLGALISGILKGMEGKELEPIPEADWEMSVSDATQDAVGGNQG